MATIINFHGIEVSVEESLYDKFNWIAQDDDGDIWLYKNEPQYCVPQYCVAGFFLDKKCKQAYIGIQEFPENIPPSERILNFKEPKK